MKVDPDSRPRHLIHLKTFLLAVTGAMVPTAAPSGRETPRVWSEAEALHRAYRPAAGPPTFAVKILSATPVLCRTISPHCFFDRPGVVRSRSGGRGASHASYMATTCHVWSLEYGNVLGLEPVDPPSISPGNVVYLPGGVGRLSVAVPQNVMRDSEVSAVSYGVMNRSSSGILREGLAQVFPYVVLPNLIHLSHTDVSDASESASRATLRLLREWRVFAAHTSVYLRSGSSSD